MRKMKTTTTTLTDTSFYCSQKFWWLSVDLGKRRFFSCCSADSEKIDISWLRNNSGQMFNQPSLIKERSMMLDNISVPGCANACWKPESQNLPSRRTMMGSDRVTHQSLHSDVEVLNILVDNQCNMTCVYCCKQYSSAWLRDCVDKGPYPVTSDDRYRANDLDIAISKLSQKQLIESDTTTFLVDEIAKLKNPGLREITVTGGEPFLYNGLIDLLEKLKDVKHVAIYTGLGVDSKRFDRMIKEISKFENVSIVISAESTEKIYEFTRYGNTWPRLNTNLEIIRRNGVSYKFYATVSNLTLFGLKDFLDFAQDTDISFNVCNTPKFLAPNVLDVHSKHHIEKNINSYPKKLQQIIAEAFSVEPTEEQHRSLSTYLEEFSQRRDLSLDIFPTHFVSWIKGKTHVV